MWNYFKCKSVRKSIPEMRSIQNAQNQLEHCEKCCYRNSKSRFKENTYRDVRLKYVQLFWKKRK